MAFALASTSLRTLALVRRQRPELARFFVTTNSAPSTSTSAPSLPQSDPESEPLTHYRITLRRSAIGLEKRVRATLEALGLHRRNQTVYQRHSGDAAGKVLRVKELVEVQNVRASDVRTALEQRRERKASRGFKVVGRAGLVL